MNEPELRKRRPARQARRRLCPLDAGRSRERLRLSLALAILGAGLTAQEAAPFRIESVQVQAPSQLVLRYPGEPEAYYILTGGQSLTQLHQPIRLQLGPVFPLTAAFRLDLPAAQAGFYRIQRVPRDQSLDTDADGADDVFELLRPRYFDPLNPADVPPFQVGTLAVPDRPTFDLLAKRSDLPGVAGARELKFLVTGVDTPYPVLYFMNTVEFEFHDAFAIAGLGWNISLAEYNAQTYFTEQNRRNLAGSFVAHDQHLNPDGSLGLYTIEFWPADPVKFQWVDLTCRLAAEAMPFAAGRLAYHPTGETQHALYAQEKASYAAANVRVITTDQLLGNLQYCPLNLGEACGRLRLAGAADTVSIRDIVILKDLPNDLSHVAAIITETPQTPLSHVNLKARQNRTPNAYIRDATTHPRLLPYLDQYVHLRIEPDDFTLASATPAEVEAFLDSLRPSEPQIPPRDLTAVAIRPLNDLGSTDSIAYGAKAANVAELAKVLPDGMVPRGYAVPFFFYHYFMEQNGFYEAAQTMMAVPAFQSDPARREHDLSAFRQRIRGSGVLPDWMMDALTDMHLALPAASPPRCRSSSNNEDLLEFSGAGLYDSCTHYPDEGHIAKSIRQVWASLWTYRAFEEREFFRVDHLRTAMGVLVHPSYPHELANGVGVTRNIYDPNWPGFYVNVQLGEDLVTNPQPDSVPDEFLISAIGPAGAYEVQYLRRSSYLPGGQTVLTSAQINRLAAAMEIIQRHFQVEVYRAEADPTFGMEIEFKIAADGTLQIKQARPWVHE
jgi:pyruvate, water dikinase